MSDDKTQEMPVMADAGDMPTGNVAYRGCAVHGMTSRSAVGVQRRMISRAWNPLQRKAFRPIPLR